MKTEISRTKSPGIKIEIIREKVIAGKFMQTTENGLKF